MPYTISWYIKNEIIYAHYSGAPTLAEMRQSLIDCNNLIDSSPRQQVHIFSDVGDVTQPVRPLDSLAIVREVGTRSRHGWTIILREKSFLIRMGVAFGTTVFKTRNRTYASIEEAIKFMKQVDPTLSWDKVVHETEVRTR